MHSKCWMQLSLKLHIHKYRWHALSFRPVQSSRWHASFRFWGTSCRDTELQVSWSLGRVGLQRELAQLDANGRGFMSRSAGFRSVGIFIIQTACLQPKRSHCGQASLRSERLSSFTSKLLLKIPTRMRTPHIAFVLPEKVLQTAMSACSWQGKFSLPLRMRSSHKSKLFFCVFH